MADSDSSASADQSSAGAATEARSDIDTGEAFTSGVYTETRSWNSNVKKLYDAYVQLDLKSAQAYADLDLNRARNSQTMWENTYAELIKDQAEIRGRRMNQFDFAVNKQWNIDEVDQLAAKTAVQQDVTASSLIARLIAALEEAKKV